MCVCVCEVASVVSDALWPYGLQHTRLLCPWDFPSKYTRIGCHSLFRGSSWLRDATHVSCISHIGKWVLYRQHHLNTFKYLFQYFSLTQKIQLCEKTKGEYYILRFNYRGERSVYYQGLFILLGDGYHLLSCENLTLYVLKALSVSNFEQINLLLVLWWDNLLESFFFWLRV